MKFLSFPVIGEGGLIHINILGTPNLQPVTIPQLDNEKEAWMLGGSPAMTKPLFLAVSNLSTCQHFSL